MTAAPIELELRVDTRVAMRKIRIVAFVLCALDFALAHRAELLTGAAFVAGWILVTAGAAVIVHSLAARFTAAVWLLSIGLLLLSLGGLQLLGRFVWHGLYSLTRKANG